MKSCSALKEALQKALDRPKAGRIVSPGFLRSRVNHFVHLLISMAIFFVTSDQTEASAFEQMAQKLQQLRPRLLPGLLVEYTAWELLLKEAG